VSLQPSMKDQCGTTETFTGPGHPWAGRGPSRTTGRLRGFDGPAPRPILVADNAYGLRDSDNTARCTSSFLTDHNGARRGGIRAESRGDGGRLVAVERSMIVPVMDANVEGPISASTALAMADRIAERSKPNRARRFASVSSFDKGSAGCEVTP
jgi:hypothetical protein